MDFVYSIKRLIDQLFPFYQIGTELPSTEIRTPVVLPLLYKKKTTTPHKKGPYVVTQFLLFMLKPDEEKNSLSCVSWATA